jgi:hypothetical protein
MNVRTLSGNQYEVALKDLKDSEYLNRLKHRQLHLEILIPRYIGGHTAERLRIAPLKQAIVSFREIRRVGGWYGEEEREKWGCSL